MKPVLLAAAAVAVLTGVNPAEAEQCSSYYDCNLYYRAARKQSQHSRIPPQAKAA